jgi:hypothetical protein
MTAKEFIDQKIKEKHEICQMPVPISPEEMAEWMEEYAQSQGEEKPEYWDEANQLAKELHEKDSTPQQGVGENEILDTIHDNLISMRYTGEEPEDINNRLLRLGDILNEIERHYKTTQNPTEQGVGEDMSQELTALMLSYAKEHCKSAATYQTDIKMQMDAMKFILSSVENKSTKRREYIRGFKDGENSVKTLDKDKVMEICRALVKRWGGRLPKHSDDVLEEYRDKICSLALPTVTEEIKICIGCGRLSTDPPIKAPALACCPDNHYLPIKKYWERSCFPSTDYQRKSNT